MTDILQDVAIVCLAIAVIANTIAIRAVLKVLRMFIPPGVRK